MKRKGPFTKNAQSMEEQNGEFMKQFSGSAAANGITMIIMVVLYGLKKCCDRPSRCKSKLHTCCLDIEVSDRAPTKRSAPSITLDQREGLPV